MDSSWKRIVLGSILIVITFGIALDRNEQRHNLRDAISANCEVINDTRENIIEYVSAQLDSTVLRINRMQYYQDNPEELQVELDRILGQRKEVSAKFASENC